MLGGAWPLPAPLPPPLVVTLQTSRNFLWVWSGVDEPTPEQKFQRTQLYLNTKKLFFTSLACTRFRVVISSSHFISVDMFFPHKDESVLGTRILLYSQLAQRYLIHPVNYQIYNMPILQEHKWCTDPPHKKTEDLRPPFRQTRRTKTHRNIILSIPRAPVQKGTFHQLCTNHSAVVLWHWSFTRSTWDQSLFYGPSWNLCFYALYKLQI